MVGGVLVPGASAPKLVRRNMVACIIALTNATFPYLLELANKGVEGACRDHPGLCAGVNTWRGLLTHRGVAESQNRAFTEFPGPA